MQALQMLRSSKNGVKTQLQTLQLFAQPCEWHMCQWPACCTLAVLPFLAAMPDAELLASPPCLLDLALPALSTDFNATCVKKLHQQDTAANCACDTHAARCTKLYNVMVL